MCGEILLGFQQPVKSDFLRSNRCRPPVRRSACEILKGYLDKCIMIAVDSYRGNGGNKMNHSALIKRAFQITKRYRVLWLFGILVALTAGGGASSSGNGSGYNFNQADLQGRNWPSGCRSINGANGSSSSTPAGMWGSSSPAAAFWRSSSSWRRSCNMWRVRRSCAAWTRSRPPAARPTWREGFRLGWSRQTFRLWLLELIVGLLAMVASLLLMALAASRCSCCCCKMTRRKSSPSS